MFTARPRSLRIQTCLLSADVQQIYWRAEMGFLTMVKLTEPKHLNTAPADHKKREKFIFLLFHSFQQSRGDSFKNGGKALQFKGISP